MVVNSFGRYNTKNIVRINLNYDNYRLITVGKNSVSYNKVVFWRLNSEVRGSVKSIVKVDIYKIPL